MLCARYWLWNSHLDFFLSFNSFSLWLEGKRRETFHLTLWGEWIISREAAAEPVVPIGPLWESWHMPCCHRVKGNQEFTRPCIWVPQQVPLGWYLQPPLTSSEFWCCALQFSSLRLKDMWQLGALLFVHSNYPVKPGFWSQPSSLP